MDAVRGLEGDAGARELLARFRRSNRWEAGHLAQRDRRRHAGGGLASHGGRYERCDTGICGGDVPPLIGQILTGTGLTLAQAAARLGAARRSRAHARPAPDGRGLRANAGALRSAEQARFGGRELLVGERAGAVQRREAFEALDRSPPVRSDRLAS